MDWVLKIWIYLILEVEILEEYKFKKEKKVYDLSFYKFSFYLRELFDILREKIKVFDERIIEKFN